METLKDKNRFKTDDFKHFIDKFKVQEGLRVCYKSEDSEGDTKLVRCEVKSFEADGNFPSIQLTNGHEARWNGAKYVIHDLDDVELAYNIKNVLHVWKGTYGSNKHSALWWATTKLNGVDIGTYRPMYALMYDMDFEYVYGRELKYYVEDEDYIVIFEKP